MMIALQFSFTHFAFEGINFGVISYKDFAPIHQHRPSIHCPCFPGHPAWQSMSSVQDASDFMQISAYTNNVCKYYISFVCKDYNILKIHFNKLLMDFQSDV